MYFKLFLKFLIPAFAIGFAQADTETWIVPVPDWDRPPYAYHSSDGTLQGIDIAILKEISKRTGIEFKFENFSFPQRQSDFVNGIIFIDCCISEEWRTTPADIEAQIFTDFLYSGYDVFLFPPGKLFKIGSQQEELNNKKVGGMKGYTYILENQYGTRVDHNTQADLLTSVSNGSVDVGILERHVAAHYARQLNLKIEFGSVQHSIDVGIRLHKSKQEFLPIFNEVIMQMKTEGVIRELIEQEAKRARQIF